MKGNSRKEKWKIKINNLGIWTSLEFIFPALGHNLSFINIFFLRL